VGGFSRFNKSCDEGELYEDLLELHVRGNGINYFCRRSFGIEDRRLLLILLL
jgi:hypothetical protein